MTPDICIISEATYPYITGGVSSCVQQIIEGSPELSFSILYLGASTRIPKTLRYQLPPNVLAIEHLWLFDHHSAETIRGGTLSRSQFDALFSLVELFSDTENIGIKVDPSELERLMPTLFGRDARLHKAVLRAATSDAFWKLARFIYQKTRPDLPFLQFYYQWRSRILPLLRIFSSEIPPAKVYYAVTTGHAGVTGVAAKLQHHRPLMLTEHGIYPRERRHDMWDLNWMRMSSKEPRDRNVLIQVRDDWLKYFDRLSFVAYFYSDVITTLFNKYIDMQVSLGADPTKCYAIANGMNVRLLGARARQPDWDGFGKGQKFRVSYIGRLVPVKDIKCLINAVTIARQSEPDIECKLFGPMEEDPRYVDSCRVLIESAGQQGVIEFMGKRAIEDILPQTDLLVLTSLSEGQPMVILEASFAGIPVVATNVGGCDELLNGGSQKDVELGQSGLLTRFGSPKETAQAILTLARDPKLWQSFAKVGMARASLYYDERRTIWEYQELFKGLLGL